MFYYVGSFSLSASSRTAGCNGFLPEKIWIRFSCSVLALKLFIFFLFSMIEIVAKLLKCLNSSAPQVHQDSLRWFLCTSLPWLLSKHTWSRSSAPLAFHAASPARMNLKWQLTWLTRSAGMSLCCLRVSLHARLRDNPNQPDSLSLTEFFARDMRRK